jgi:hypothetical protein
MIGKNVEVFWLGDQEWYAGMVLGLHRTHNPPLAKAVVTYDDDGGLCWEDAWQENVNFQVLANI